MLCKNVLTVAPEIWLGILEVETGIFLKCIVNLLACSLWFFALLPSHNNLLFPPLSRLLVFRRPVPGAGEALRGCCWQAVGQAAGPRHHRRLQGVKTRQPPSRLAHALQWKGYGTALLLEALARIMRALGACGCMESVSFSPLTSKATTPETFPCSPEDDKRSAKNSFCRALCPLASEPLPL